MHSVIEYISLNRDWIRPIWFILGIIGLLIMKDTRPSFYKNKPFYWWIIVTFWYMLIGPLIFTISCITLFNPDKK